MRLPTSPTTWEEKWKYFARRQLTQPAVPVNAINNPLLQPRFDTMQAQLQPSTSERWEITRMILYCSDTPTYQTVAVITDASGQIDFIYIFPTGTGANPSVAVIDSSPLFLNDGDDLTVRFSRYDGSPMDGVSPAGTHPFPTANVRIHYNLYRNLEVFGNL